ncbi:unnamed protein product [Peronospora belbahrii]|uniref:EB1 C-terminal domain-containing protein n=1 Tax=Peronospora belbahrii TaxID=622444 RepID=A0AAU9KWB7_9STRA|nr:unnamed protein product [Peronospora belbahrii]
MPEIHASVSHTCGSPVKNSPVIRTGIRYFTNIRSPMKLPRTWETHRTLKTAAVHKRLLEAEDKHMESALLGSKRMKISTMAKIKAPSDHLCNFQATVNALQTSKDDDDSYTDNMDGLCRQKKVAQCLEQDLLRDNARMRLKAISLKDEVDFYYEILARIELLAAQQRLESGEKSKQVSNLLKQIHRVISAPKPVKETMQTTNHSCAINK